MSNGSTAVVIGGTGEMGGHILRLLLTNDYYTKVIAIGRSSVEKLPKNPKLCTRVVSFALTARDQYNPEDFEGADLFYAIGADPGPDFARQEIEILNSVIRAASGRVRSFNMVSAMGANAGNSYYRYLCIKGIEEDIVRHNEVGVQRFYRPAMLLANDRPTISRADAASIWFFEHVDPLMHGRLENWRGVKPVVLAQAMVNNAEFDAPSGIYMHEGIVKAAKHYVTSIDASIAKADAAKATAADTNKPAKD